MSRVFCLSFLYVFISSVFLTIRAQGLEHELSAGPQTTIVTIKDYQVGLIGGTVPQSDRLLMGYTFNWTARTKLATFQPGLQLKSDMTRYNVYLPVFFPSDAMEEDQSRWDNIYTAYRLGAGASLRINMNSFFVQPGVSYLLELATKTKHQFYIASLDKIEETDGEDYTSGSGMAGEMQIGLKLGKGPAKRYGVSLGVQYLFKRQTYTDETFLQYWEVQPLDVFLLLSYRFLKAS